MPPKEGKSEDETSPELALLLAKRELYFERINSLYNYARNIDQPEMLEKFKIKFATLEENRTQFATVIDKIHLKYLETQPNYKPDFKSLDALEDLCDYIREKSKVVFKPVSEGKVFRSPAKITPQLPKIELAEFSGDPKSWPVFYETFRTLIHENSELDDTSKLHYLIGQLSGSALKVCSGVTPTAKNYPIIWKSLVDKYEDKRVLASSYLTQILSFKPLQSESAIDLNQFLDQFDSNVQALKQIEIDDLSDFVFAYIALSKLDHTTRRNFESSNRGSSVPSYRNIIDFVKEEAKILSHAGNFAASPKQKPSTSTVGVVKSKVHSFVAQDRTPSQGTKLDQNFCPICDQNTHKIYQCPKFLAAPPNDRFKMVKSKSLCINCLSTSHRLVNCRSVRTCNSCNSRHHSLIHFPKNDVTSTNTVSLADAKPYENPKVPPTSTVSCLSASATSTILPTAVVLVNPPQADAQTVRLLLDSGSQSNFLTLECCHRLGLNIHKHFSSITGIGNSSHLVRGRVELVFTSRMNPSVKYPVTALVLNKIADFVPNTKAIVSSLDYLKGLPLADDKFFDSPKVDGIIGAELIPHLLGSEKVVGPPNCPVAIETTLGFVIMGKSPIIDRTETSHALCSLEALPIENALQQFWALEETPTVRLADPDDEACELLYTKTVTRKPSGQYEVSLPFKSFPPQLGESFSVAYRRFCLLEKRLLKNPSLKIDYSDALQDYINQGHLALVSDSAETSLSYFIPHHAVFKDSSSTPLRIVFDASAPTGNNISLNDTMFTGPKLQSDIVTLLINFRLFKIALTADVRQMYRQISICPEHRRFQRILWRFCPSDPLQIYEITVVSFGVKASPFLAIRTIHQLADDEKSQFPNASIIAKRDTYMDDLVTCVPDANEAIAVYRELVGLFTAGGFDLVKWASNCSDVLSVLPPSTCALPIVEFSEDPLKVLGFRWHPNSDLFSFSVNFESNPCTKRRLLSTIARIWDPLGLLAPAVLFVKLLIKELWLRKLNWDDPTPADILQTWSKFESELPVLEKIKIPRYLGFVPNNSVCCLGFADASEKGYGAAIYARTIKSDGSIVVNLICAKSKVAPVKTLSIPRLELCAALLLAKLLDFVITCLRTRIVVSEMFAFSDSTVVINWIQSSPHRWSTFVGNRVSKIQNLIPPRNWFHIDGKCNPADLLSRGCTPAKLINNPVWFHGPTWILADESVWPVHQTAPVLENIPEEKVTALVAHPESLNSPNPLLELVARKSSWIRLLRTVVYVLKFLRLLPRRTAILAEDLTQAKYRLLRALQHVHFAKEIQLIEKNLPVSGFLRSLCPFLEKGLLRVGGRLSNSSLDFDHKHPILLPKRDPLVILIIDHYHKAHFHAGPNLLLSILRQEYWILSARNLVRQRIRLCNVCFRLKPLPLTPKMSDLPAPRVTESVKPFFHCGVDYAGPFAITTKRRGVKPQKGYLCLFICLSTKAVHLELASDLSTATFLAALKRFLSRRGTCRVLYSDRGTNFIGANQELKHFIYSAAYKQSFGNFLSHNEIEWKFNPPAAPHFGGLWEANVKSAKAHFYKAIGAQVLTYEELSTVFSQIEALLNSRPLCALSSDPNEPVALTPAHFLTTHPLSFFPAPNLSQIPSNRVERKYLVDQIVQTYWKRWKSEYLGSLQGRQKWSSPIPSVETGTMVVLIVDNIPPLHWPLGIVTKVFPGNDGCIRVVEVKTKNGTYTRPVVRLCPLPSQ